MQSRRFLRGEVSNDMKTTAELLFNVCFWQQISEEMKIKPYIQIGRIWKSLKGKYSQIFNQLSWKQVLIY